MSGCEEYATEFEVNFNGNKRQLLFFRGRECVSSILYGSPLWSLKCTLVESIIGEKRGGHCGMLTPEHIVILLPLYLIKCRKSE